MSEQPSFLSSLMVRDKLALGTAQRLGGRSKQAGGESTEIQIRGQHEICDACLRRCRAGGVVHATMRGDFLCEEVAAVCGLAKLQTV